MERAANTIAWVNYIYERITFSVFTLLFRTREGHPACKKFHWRTLRKIGKLSED